MPMFDPPGLEEFAEYAKLFESGYDDLCLLLETFYDICDRMRKVCISGQTWAVDELLDKEKGKYSAQKEWFLYFLHRSSTGDVKIGITTDIDKRIRSLASGSGLNIDLIGCFQFTERKAAAYAEKQLHLKYDQFRKDVTSTGAKSTEWFSDDVAASLPKTMDELIDSVSEGSSKEWLSSFAICAEKNACRLSSR